VQALDLIKLILVAAIFLVAAPAAGVALKRKPNGQRLVFALMCFMTINGLFGPGNWGLTLFSIEWYRGHTKGYHFYFNHALAIALIVARLLENPKDFRWLPPGLGLYLLYCLMSFVSVFNAPVKDYTFMAAHKMIFASVLLLATYNVIRTEDDLKYFLRVMVFTMLWEVLIVLKMKYLEGMYQVRGTFEHQNPLAMYSVMIGMIFFATSLGPSFKGSNLCLAGYLVCAVIVECTLSRAALAIFAVGSMAVLGLSIMEKPTKRRILSAAALSVVAVAGLLVTLDTIMARFNDKGNESSKDLRRVMNLASREMLRDYPTGIGWNNFAHTFNPPFRYTEILNEWITSRNMKVREDQANPVVESHYWLLLAETGYQGFGAYLLMIGIGLWRNLRGFWFFGHRFLRCFCLGLAVGCGLNYTQSLLERVLVQPRNLMLWLILYAMIGRIESWRREAVKQKSIARRASPAPLRVRAPKLAAAY